MTNDLNERSSSIPEEFQHRLIADDSLFSNESNEKLLMILNKNSGLAPYSHEFSKGSLDPQVISGFVSAMTSFMGVVTGEKLSHWKTVYGSDSVILVEKGDWTIGVLAASRETNEARSKLRSAVLEFEDCFAVLKNADGIDGSAFRDYNQYVRMMFVDERITGRTLVTKRLEWRGSISNFDLPSVAFSVSKILLGIEDTQTVKEIAEFQNLQIEEVIEIVAKAFWCNTVFLKFIPAENDILTLSEGASTILFQKTNPLNLTNASLSVIACFDGRTPFFHFTSSMDDHELKVLLDNLGTLVNRGLIQRISAERRRVLFNECILSFLSSRGASIIGHKQMKQIFDTIRRVGGDHHPWISRVKLTDRIQAQCILEESMTPTDLDDMANALEFLITEMGEQLSKRYVGRVVERMLRKIRNDCQASWTPNLTKLVS
ncbi:MAG: hypothetical protein ACXACG_05800 [Candidatus Thorarchaeota archaeon]